MGKVIHYLNLKQLVEQTRKENIKLNVFLLFFIACILLVTSVQIATGVLSDFDAYVTAAICIVFVVFIVFMMLIQSVIYYIFTPKQLIYTDVLKIVLVSTIIETFVYLVITLILSRFMIIDENLSNLISTCVTVAVKFYVVFQIKRVYFDVLCKRTNVLVGILGLGLISQLIVYFGG